MNQPDKNTDLKQEIETSAKLFDVAKPGNSAPQSTSRPVIVRHNSGIKHDPMVTAEPGSESNKDDSNNIKIRTGPKIIPTIPAVGSTDNTLPAPNETQSEEEKTSDTVAQNSDESSDEKPSEPISEPENKDETITEEAESVDHPNEAAIDSLASEVTAKRQSEKDEEAQNAKYQEVLKYTQSREFFVPIGQVSRRRSHNRLVLLFILSLLIIAAGINFAIDAEAIDIGFNALTDLL